MAGEPTDTHEQPTEALVSGTVGDRCVSCGSPLSSDQRYCVVCGERRGAPRFTLPTPAAATAEPAAARPPTEPRRPRSGAGTTLVAGVATLLLAMLVGVLIGHNTAGNGKTIAAGPTKIIKVVSGAAAPAAAAASTPASSSSTGGGSETSSKRSGAKPKPTQKTAPISKKTAASESSAASKVTGGSGGAPPTVTVGGRCSTSSAGCDKKTGKFNGSFFGG